jgi:hypothetical protein
MQPELIAALAAAFAKLIAVFAGIWIAISEIKKA